MDFRLKKKKKEILTQLDLKTRQHIFFQNYFISSKNIVAEELLFFIITGLVIWYVYVTVQYREK